MDHLIAKMKEIITMKMESAASDQARWAAFHSTREVVPAPTEVRALRMGLL
jgi:hypothetical protein